MDGSRFDALTRSFAQSGSRRRVLGGLIAGALGLGGLRETDAFVCREPGRTCREHADCCSRYCGPKDDTGRHRCLCQTAADCPPAKVCHTVACTAGECVTSVTPGATCILPGGGTGTCQGGTCVLPTTTAGPTTTSSTTSTTTTTTSTSTTSTTTTTTTPPPTTTTSTTPTGCFVAGTRVAMADGTSAPIELVAVGDRVLGRDGCVNIVVDVLRPELGVRPLFALNGGRAFVTAGHPFATETGWKAIDPAATAREMHHLAVGRLALGDRLLALTSVRVLVAAGGPAADEPAEMRLEPVALGRLERHVADPATPLYNLVLDGNHTYFADDFLVHNKYG